MILAKASPMLPPITLERLRLIGLTTGNSDKQVSKFWRRFEPLTAGEPLANASPRCSLPFLFGMKSVIEPDSCGTLAPLERWQRNAIRVQPSGFLGTMPVMSLVNAARPSALGIGINPSARPRRGIQSKRLPRSGCSRMLKHSTEAPHGSKSSGETAIVITLHAAHLRTRPPRPIPSPSFAGWMCDDAVRAVIASRVLALAPDFNTRNPCVWAILQDEQCSDLATVHASPSNLSMYFPL